MKDPTDATRPSATTPNALYRRPGQLTLRVVSGPNTGAKLVTSKDRVIVGRSRTTDLTLDHSSVSAVHFELRVGAHGIELRDMNSTNGTRVGPLTVVHALVQPGVLISAGDCDVKIEAVDDIDIQVMTEGRLGAMLGSSPIMRETFAKIRSIAEMPLDALVVGETGTGKELASRAIHDLSNRRHGPFVTLDCGTLARSLTEAAIFGYKRGAFTGAEKDTSGFVERAEGGTLFLDEIGELPIDLQVKLLRVIDRREFVRIGDTELRTVDIRVVAATNRDLDKMVAEGKFREDLFHRLSQAKVELPPLRRRDEDILLLAEWRAQQIGDKRGIGISLSSAVKTTLLKHGWPGNIRELLNAIEYAAYATESGTISTVHVEPIAAGQGVEQLCLLRYGEANAKWRKIYLSRALKRAKGSVAACSRLTGVPRTTLRRWLDEYEVYYIDDDADD